MYYEGTEEGSSQVLKSLTNKSSLASELHESYHSPLRIKFYQTLYMK